MNYLAQIVKAANVSVPVEAPSLADWRFVEESLGVELPKDYKDLVSTLGSGCFGECLSLRNPISSRDLNRMTRKVMQDLAVGMDWVREVLGCGLFPEPGGVFSIGSAAATVHLFLETSPSSKVTGRLILFHRDLYVYTVDERPLTEILWNLYSAEQTEKIRTELKELLWPKDVYKPFFLSGPD